MQKDDISSKSKAKLAGRFRKIMISSTFTGYYGNLVHIAWIHKDAHKSGIQYRYSH